MITEKDIISLGFSPRDNEKYGYLHCHYYIDNGTDNILGVSIFDKGKVIISIEDKYDFEGYNGIEFNITNITELSNILNLIVYKGF